MAAPSLDWRVYREFSLGCLDSVWQQFPPPPIGQIAKELGVSRNAVWLRFKEWTRSGVFSGYDVIPNPDLFGVELLIYRARFNDARARARFLESLRYVDGVVLAEARLGLDTNQGFVGITAVSGSRTARERLEQHLRRLDGPLSIELSPNSPRWHPPCNGTLSLTDWKILRALREGPRTEVSRLARVAGVSPRTFSRRYRMLRERGAVLSNVLEDLSHFPHLVAEIDLSLTGSSKSRSIAAKVQGLIPDGLEMPMASRPKGSPAKQLAFAACFVSVADINPVLEAAAGLPEVESVRIQLLGEKRRYPHWWDERIREAIESRRPLAS